MPEDRHIEASFGCQILPPTGWPAMMLCTCERFQPIGVGKRAACMNDCNCSYSATSRKFGELAACSVYYQQRMHRNTGLC